MTPRQRFVSTALGVLAGVVAGAGVLAVVVAAFALSFDAIRTVGQAAHIRADWAWMLPVAVDGAMSTAAVCAVVLRRMGRRPVYPWCVVTAGAAVSIVCNGLHAYVGAGALELPAAWAVGVSAVPPVLLALSVHLLVILAEAVRSEPTVTSENGLRATESRETRPTPTRTRGKPRRASTRERVAAAAARTPDATPAQLAARLGVSERTVQRYLPPAPVEASPNGKAT